MTPARAENNQTVLFTYPRQATFGRVLPKNKIYEYSGANTRLKGLFVEQVEQIVWQYKLAPETINLPASPAVPEIQVFTLQLRTPELHRDVLRCIDGAVKFPILYELNHGQAEEARIQVVAAYKRPHPTDAESWVLSDYFATQWLPASSQRAALPLALDLASLYEQLLHRLIPLPARPQESLAELTARVALVVAKRREVEKTASKLAKEKQFNRKVAINATLRTLKTELEQLSR